MNVFWTTWKRELMGYFFSPVGYLIAVLLYLYRGFEVSSIVKRVSYIPTDVDAFASDYMLRNSSLMMIVLVPPILTMRCFAEERRSGSIEVLLTAPVRSWEIVLGKWAAAFVFFGMLWWPTLLLLGVLSGERYLATDISFGPVFAGYIGLALIGSLVLAAGVFTSSLTDNVLLAALSGILFSWGLISLPAIAMPYVLRYSAEYPMLEGFFGQLNVFEQLGNWFGRGLIDSGHVTFYVAGTVFFLFLTTRALEARRWR